MRPRLCAVPLVVVAALALPAAATAVAPGGNGPIAFTKFIRGTGTSVRVVNPNGTFESVVTGQGGAPAWSPNGRLLAYGASDGLWVHDVYAGTRRRLTPETLIDLGWSPDGRQIVYSRTAGDNSNLSVIAVGGGAPRRLTSEGGQVINSEPDWSPDGSRIVYGRKPLSGSAPPTVQVVRADGSGGPTVLARSDSPADPSPGPSWAPDGSRIAFTASDTFFQIDVVNPDGSGRARLTQLDRNGFDPAWSPAGDQLALTTSSGSGGNQISVVNRDGSGARRVPVDGFVSDPAWGSGPLLTRKLPGVATSSVVTASVVSGKVFVKRRGGRRFLPLTGSASLPYGSQLDTRGGRVRITAEAGKGSSATSDFYDGVFKLVRRKGSITELALSGRLAGCRSRGARANSSARRKGRRLWGSGKGRFRTRGRRSAATITRGTRWLVEDRCDGSTLTRVASGRVTVRDFARRRNVRLRAGQRHVAGRRR